MKRKNNKKKSLKKMEKDIMKTAEKIKKMTVKKLKKLAAGRHFDEEEALAYIAKEITEPEIKKILSTINKGKYWESFREIAEEVDNWPEWKKSGISALRLNRHYHSDFYPEK